MSDVMNMTGSASILLASSPDAGAGETPALRSVVQTSKVAAQPVAGSHHQDHLLPA